MPGLYQGKDDITCTQTTGQLHVGPGHLRGPIWVLSLTPPTQAVVAFAATAPAREHLPKVAQQQHVPALLCVLTEGFHLQKHRFLQKQSK